ncbi:glycosyltransferase [uncultured Psychrobacter sp.]|uniref:glycosyltransferase n=1 Tax=uncultured Psychrobacter sp. TaxID=259303 RepID=UPI0025991BFB|nr:glycosyltransferase [uncultured Psychrobacter sp.]
MNILHLTPDLNWSKIFILPIAELQSIEASNVYISAPYNNSSSLNSKSVNTLTLIGKLKNPKAHFIGLYKLIKSIKSNSIDRVYLHTSIDSCLPIIFIRILTNVEVIYINHGVPYDGYKGLLRALFMLVELSNLTFSHRSISITKSMTVLLEKINIFSKRIDTLQPGTISGVKFKTEDYYSLLKYRQSYNPNIDDVLKIVYVARIEQRKGVFELIEAVNNSQYENIHLSILGNGIENLKEIDYDSNKISIEGYIDDITDFYLAADILIVPSYHEGFGQVYLESASLGVIPVCSDVPGPTDFIINEFNGFTVPPKDAKAITTLLDNIINGKYDLEQIRLNAFNSAKKFDSRTVLENNIKVFNK